MATVVAVVGTIAGAGATTVVTALGTALGEQRRQVALVDATAEGSRIDGGGDLADALRRGTAVGDVQASGPHDVAAFPADAETGWGSMRPDAVATLYDQLRDRFEFVLVDCGSSLSPARSAWLGHADEAVIVTDPDVAGTVPETVALADAFDVPVRGVLANRVPPKEVGEAVDALAGTGQTVLGVLPEDPTVGIAADAGASVLRTEPDSAIATCAWKLALRVRESDHDEPVVPEGTGPPPGAEGVGSPERDSDVASDASASDVDDRNRGAEDVEDDRDGGEGESAATVSSPEPAPAADAVGTPPPDPDSRADLGSDDPGGEDPDSEVPRSDLTGGEDPGGGDAVGGDADGGDADGGNAAGDSNGHSASAEAEDPFTEPEPRAVEDAGTDESGESGCDATASESLDGLLGDVRARIDDEPRSQAEPTDSVGRDDPGAGDASDVDHDEHVGDAEASSPGGSTEFSSADDEPERDGRGSNRETNEPEWADDTSAQDASGSDDDGAVLSDDEIESLFEETMERVSERRESEQEVTDGSEAVEGGPETAEDGPDTAEDGSETVEDEPAEERDD